MIQIPDVLILLAYFFAMIWVGAFFSRRMRNIGQFFGGGRRVPWWLSAISFYMTTFSAFALIMYSELAYRHGLVALTVFWMSVPASVLTGYFFATRWRRAARTSPLEFVEERYGPVMRQGLAWLNIPLRVIDSGLKLLAIGLLITGALGLGAEWTIWAILFSGLAVFIYTFLGGLWGVLVTDFVQAIVMFFAVLILLPLAVSQAGGFDAIFRAMPGEFYHLTTETYNFPYLIAWLVVIMLNYSSGWALVQRFYSVDSDRSARKVAYSVAFLHFVTPPILFAPAVAARVFMPDLPPEDVARVYSILIRDLLPVGLIGLMMAAMFAATMSMISSDYNAMASVLTNDVYKGWLRRDAGERRLLIVGRFTTLAIGLCSLGIAILILRRPEDQSLFDIMVGLFTLFLPPMAVPMLAGLCSRKVTNGGGLVGLIMGIGAGLLVYILSTTVPALSHLSRNYYVVPITVGSSFIGLIAGTLLIRSTEESQRRIDRFFEQMDAPPEPPGKVSVSAISTPLYITGMALLFLGAVSFLAVIPVLGEERVWLSAVVSALMALIGAALFLLNRRGLRTEDSEAQSTPPPGQEAGQNDGA